MYHFWSFNFPFALQSAGAGTDLPANYRAVPPNCRPTLVSDADYLQAPNNECAGA